MGEPTDERWMAAAVDAAAGVRATAHPNPWVGCAIVAGDQLVALGATRPPGQAHAEVDALERAGDAARGATAYVTLEPCSHHGRTGPCADALVHAGVARVVVAVTDPDPRVSGEGIERLRSAGITVDVGPGAGLVDRQLAPYLHHRRTGRPYVVLKLAATLDGRTAAPDGSSRWITGSEARADVHRLRAESDSVVVGAGTVRADDPRLDVRDAEGPDPERIVLGVAPAGANVHPCTEWRGPLDDLLDDLGRRGHVQTLVEGGAGVAASLHAGGHVDRYVLYLAPALLGGDDGRGLFAGAGAATISDAWRGRIDAVTTLGDDLRIDLVPRPEGTP
ncbi:MAG TPA: bifunctional diaminohydroxyphosphoribosylaminopyrimidine deaminase/5-amino-6-(5-phosphoribosylamino)uracil reductase RibD [Acidimicrobiales bacterium]|nr:bifunctional diaminohydroxyphosphoribosylaminopyrimidine deaminase/5-amino-6-(5-phosphoribosylamino)uracil reductase RibD [Acidimicrobiales bacterium]